MAISLGLDEVLNFTCVIAASIFFISRLEASQKNNKDWFTLTINRLQDNIENKFKFLESSINAKFECVDEKFASMKEDIDDLRLKQEEANKVKERLAFVEHTLEEAAYKEGVIEKTMLHIHHKD